MLSQRNSDLHHVCASNRNSSGNKQYPRPILENKANNYYWAGEITCASSRTLDSSLTVSRRVM